MMGGDTPQAIAQSYSALAMQFCEHAAVQLLKYAEYSKLSTPAVVGVQCVGA